MTPTPFYVRLGSNLRAIRERNGLSAERIGEILGLSTDSVLKYEQGQRKLPIELLVKAADVLHVSIMTILAGMAPESYVKPGTEYNVLSPCSSMILNTIATDWDGDVEALIIYLGLVSAFPDIYRRDLYRDAAIMKDTLLANGIIKEEQLPPGLDYMESQIGNLYNE